MQTNQSKASRTPHVENIAYPIQFRATQTECVRRNRLEACVSTLMLLVAAVLLVSHSHALADGFDHWHWRNPLPTGNSIRGVAYGNGVFVAVGHGGTIQTSTTGLDWNAVGRPTTAALNRVAFANGLFVAVGKRGVIFTSPDGSAWTERQSGTGTNLLSIVYGNSIFLAGGAGGTVLRSGNGIDWSVSSTGYTNDLDWSAYGNGMFLLPTPPPAGPSWSWPPGKILVSSNGQDWSPQTVVGGGGNVHQAVFASGKFLLYMYKFDVPPAIAIPYFFISPDGITWAQSAASATAYHDRLFSLNNQFAEVMETSQTSANRSIRFSSDGQTWTTPAELPVPYYDAMAGYMSGAAMADAAFANGRYVLVGLVGRTAGLITFSTDGVNWPLVTSGVANLHAQLAWGNSMIVAVGSAFPSTGSATLGGSPAAILICTNGLSFVPAPVASTQALASVAFHSSNFVAVGRNGALQRSTNGTHWTVRPSASSSDLASVCYGSNIWVAVGVGGTVVTSPDGLVWTLRTSGTSINLYGVTFHSGKFVAVGEQGTVLTSPDGINWTGQFADTLNALFRVASGNGRFVAVGNGGTVVTSPNGETWTTQTPPTTWSLYGLSFGNGQFLALGTPSASINFGVLDNENVILRSYDGVDWDPLEAPSYHRYTAAMFATNTFWIAGYDGTVLESDPVTGQPLLAARFLTNGLYELTIKGRSAQDYRVQACTNLNDEAWHDVYAVSNSQPVEKWTDAASAAAPVRFYRIVSP